MKGQAAPEIFWEECDVCAGALGLRTSETPLWKPAAVPEVPSAAFAGDVSGPPGRSGAWLGISGTWFCPVSLQSPTEDWVWSAGKEGEETRPRVTHLESG